MSTRQALTAALTILSRTDQLVEAGFTRDQANDGARQAALQILAEVVR